MRRAALALLALAPSLAPSLAIASPADWAGHWTGVAVDRGAGYRIARPIDLTIRQQGMELVLEDDDRMRAAAEPVPVTVHGARMEAHYKALWPTAISLSAIRCEGGKVLCLTMRGDGMTGLETHIARLHRDGADFKPYTAPRLDAHKRRVKDDVWRRPAAMGDGLPVASPEEVGLQRAPLEAMVRAILGESGAHAEHQTESVLVLRHGRLVLEDYFWGETSANPHIISSATKSVTSILAGMAFDDGRLDPDRTVASYFPERGQSLWVRDQAPISVRAMLSMSAGTDFDRPGVPANSIGLLTTHDLAGFAMDVPPVHPAGAVYNYDNSLPSLAGVLVARQERLSLEQLARQRLFAPLGIANLRWTMMPQGIPLAAGGLYLRPRDMAKIGQMMLDKGLWHGRRILSAEWIAQSTRQQTGPALYPYGYYWHINNAASPRVPGWDGYMALGQGGQVIAVFPKQDMVVVITSADWAVKAAARNAPFDLINRYVVPSLTAGRL